jgi:hypothetical protein
MTNTPAAEVRAALSHMVRAFDNATGTRRTALSRYASEAAWTLSHVALADLAGERPRQLARACRNALYDADLYYPAA